MKALSVMDMQMLSSLRMRLLALLWGLSIIAGAIVLKLTRPELPNAPAAHVLGCEPFHIAAHTFLYGTLGLFCCTFVGKRLWLVPLLDLAIGLPQEYAQVYFAGRPMGGPELFDLTNDALAGLLALLVWK